MSTLKHRYPLFRLGQRVYNLRYNSRRRIASEASVFWQSRVDVLFTFAVSLPLLAQREPVSRESTCRIPTITAKFNCPTEPPGRVRWRGRPTPAP